MALPSTASLPQSGSIVSRWKFDEASGNRADSVGSNTLTDNNTVTSAAGQFSTDAADFEAGNTEYLSIADGSQSGLDLSGDFSLGVWVKVESTPTGTGYTIINKMGAVDGDESYVIEYRDFAGTIRLRCFFENSSNAGTDARRTQTLTTGTWYHLVCVVTASGPTVQFYLDGAALGASTMVDSSATSIRNSGATFSVGYRADPAIFPFDGMMQDMVLWNLALSGAEVTSFYNAYFAAAANHNPLLLLGVG